jgi:hypothetical protein
MDFFSGFPRQRVAYGDIEINTVGIYVCGRALLTGHYLAEEVPELIYTELTDFFSQGSGTVVTRAGAGKSRSRPD